MTDPTNVAQIQAARDFNQAIISKLATENGVHAETAISAASRMAGTLLIHASGLPLDNFKPGSPILSDNMNERGQEMLKVVDQTLDLLKVPFDATKLDYDLPPDHSPLMELLETQSLLEEPFRAVLTRHGLTAQQGAYAAAISTAMLIQQCSGILDPHVAYVIAAYGMVQAVKTVPARA